MVNESLHAQNDATIKLVDIWKEMPSYKRQDAFTSLRDLSRVPLMMMLPLQKLVLKSTSKMSLNNRFTQPSFSTTGWSEDQETRVEPRVELRIEPRVSLL